MNRTPCRRAWLYLFVLTAVLGLAGCSNNSNDNSEADRAYLSHLDQARFYMEQGQYKAALQEAQSAIQSRPSERAPYLIASQVFLKAGDAGRAAQYYRELLEVNADTADPQELKEARFGLAEALGALGQFEGAQKVLDELANPSREDETRMLTLQSQWALRQENLDQARALANRALKRDPNAVEALIVLSRVAWGEQDKTHARQLLDKALGLAPTNVEVLTWNAQLADLEKRWPEAEEAYVALLDQVGSVDIMTPRKFTAISRLIEVLRAQGKHSEAFAYQDQLDKSAPGTLRNLLTEAQSAYEKGDLDTAERNLEKALQQAPGFKNAGILMGMVKVRKGDWAAADRYLSQYGGGSDSPVVTKALATTKLKLQKYDEAELLLRQVDEKDSDFMTLLGIASARTGNTAEAILNLEAALRQNPSDDLRKKLAQVYIQDRQASKALALIKDIQDTSSWDTTGLKVAALASLAQFDKAEAEAQAWLKKNPTSAEGYNALGALYSQQKKWDEAEKAYSRALSLNPAHAATWNNRIKVWRAQDKWDKVLEVAEAGLTQIPNDLPLLRAFVRAAARVKLGDQTDERLKAIALKTGEATPLFPVINRAILLKDFERAQSLIEQARTLNAPSGTLDEAQFRLNLEKIGALIKDKSYEEALGLADQTITQFEDKIGPYLLKTRVLMVSGREKDAFALLRAIKQRFPTESAPYELEGDILASQKKYEAAADAYQLGWYQKPSQGLAVKMYQVLRAANQPKLAATKLEAWLDRAPESPQALTLLAMNYQSSGNLDKALELYEKALALRPNDAVVLNNLAWLYQELGKGNALTTAQKAYELLPENAAIADTYGYILMKNGKFEAAKPVLEKAYQLSPDTRDIALHLAETLEKLGDSGQAATLRSKFN